MLYWFLLWETRNLCLPRDALMFILCQGTSGQKRERGGERERSSYKLAGKRDRDRDRERQRERQRERSSYKLACKSVCVRERERERERE